VHADGVDIGAVQQRLVGVRLIGADPLDQLELAQELGSPRFGGGGGEFGGSGFFRRQRCERVCAFWAQYRSS
jgi:hypothetical protein